MKKSLIIGFVLFCLLFNNFGFVMAKDWGEGPIATMLEEKGIETDEELLELIGENEKEEIKIMVNGIHKIGAQPSYIDPDGDSPKEVGLAFDNLQGFFSYDAGSKIWLKNPRPDECMGVKEILILSGGGEVEIYPEVKEYITRYNLASQTTYVSSKIYDKSVLGKGFCIQQEIITKPYSLEEYGKLLIEEEFTSARWISFLGSGLLKDNTPIDDLRDIFDSDGGVYTSVPGVVTRRISRDVTSTNHFLDFCSFSGIKEGVAIPTFYWYDQIKAFIGSTYPYEEKLNGHMGYYFDTDCLIYENSLNDPNLQEYYEKLGKLELYFKRVLFWEEYLKEHCVSNEREIFFRFFGKKGYCLEGFEEVLIQDESNNLKYYPAKWFSLDLDLNADFIKLKDKKNILGDFAQENLNKIKIDPQGNIFEFKIIPFGRIWEDGNAKHSYKINITKYLSDGSFDLSFGEAGVFSKIFEKDVGFIPLDFEIQDNQVFIFGMKNDSVILSKIHSWTMKKINEVIEISIPFVFVYNFSSNYLNEFEILNPNFKETFVKFNRFFMRDYRFYKDIFVNGRDYPFKFFGKFYLKSDGKILTSFFTIDSFFNESFLEFEQKFLVSNKPKKRHPPFSDSDSFVLFSSNAEGNFDTDFGKDYFSSSTYKSGGLMYSPYYHDSLKNAFTFSGLTNARYNKIIETSDGGLLIVGSAITGFDSKSDFMLIKLDSDGLIDTSFGEDGTGFVMINFLSGFSDIATDAVVDSDGNILVAGYSYPGEQEKREPLNYLSVAKLYSNGSLANCFKEDSCQGGGKILSDFNSEMYFDKLAGLDDEGNLFVVGESEGKLVRVNLESIVVAPEKECSLPENCTAVLYCETYSCEEGSCSCVEFYEEDLDENGFVDNSEINLVLNNWLYGRDSRSQVVVANILNKWYKKGKFLI